EVLSGVMNHGLSCDVCKFKVHKRCASKAPNNCKWSTLATVGKSVIENEEGLWIPHQWLEGNLPVSAKCAVCEKTCGSVLRLQDSRCLWCRSMVHSTCKGQMPAKCSLGSCKMSIIPPTAIHSQDADEFWQAVPTPQCSSRLLVFVNSKSGDNQGVKFLRRFRQYLNPAQVFDLMCSGPQVGLKMFSKFESFRILICGGDGSIGWVLSEMDKFNLNNKAQVGVLPLGTGNDLAQVMGWGNVCDDDTQVPAIIEKYEKSSTKLLDRWSILAYEGSIPVLSGVSMKINNLDPMDQYEDTVSDHLATILNSEKNAEVISSAAVLCETLKDFVAKVASSGNSCEMAKRCKTLDEKLASLLATLTLESKMAEKQQLYSVSMQPTTAPTNFDPQQPEGRGGGVVLPEIVESKVPNVRSHAIFEESSQLMLRANSLKKAVRRVIEHTEGAVDEQNQQTQKKLSTQFEEEDTEVPATLASSAIQTIERVLTDVVTSTTNTQSYPCRLNNKGPLNPKTQQPNHTNKYPYPLINTICFPPQSFTRCTRSPNVGVSSAEHCSQTPIRSAPQLNSLLTEKCVMNSYFGIGLDAKITLDFHKKREDNPKKCSRAKNRMWFGVLATKETAVKTYKNLNQRIRLECDGIPICLPALQGIVVMNIPSFMGGANFWGNRSGNEIFMPPSFNDKMLEVLAVFSTVQLGMAIVVPEGVLQHHRIAQCRSIKITILGDEPVPLQIDGEAWLQPPGIVKIEHKNRVKMLARDRRLEVALKSWEGKHRYGIEKSMISGSEFISEVDVSVINESIDTVTAVATCMSESVAGNNLLCEELLPQVSAVLRANAKLRPSGRLSDGATNQLIVNFFDVVRDLSARITSLLTRNCEDLGGPEIADKMLHWLDWIDIELKNIQDPRWAARLVDDGWKTQIGLGILTRLCDVGRPGGKFRLFRKAQKKDKSSSHEYNVNSWTSEDVGAWLDANQLHDYRDLFCRNDIQGKELLKLDLTDLKDLGITKMGHLKRLQSAIRDL
uniref:Diacylglycerol kinase n=1 Tax=Ciona savignyi TaxID=51511 RepID=H2YKX4_CIOSA